MAEVRKDAPLDKEARVIYKSVTTVLLDMELRLSFQYQVEKTSPAFIGALVSAYADALTRMLVLYSEEEIEAILCELAGNVASERAEFSETLSKISVN